MGIDIHIFSFNFENCQNRISPNYFMCGKFIVYDITVSLIFPIHYERAWWEIGLISDECGEKVTQAIPSKNNCFNMLYKWLKCYCYKTLCNFRTKTRFTQTTIVDVWMWSETRYIGHDYWVRLRRNMVSMVWKRKLKKIFWSEKSFRGKKPVCNRKLTESSHHSWPRKH